MCCPEVRGFYLSCVTCILSIWLETPLTPSSFFPAFTLPLKSCLAIWPISFLLTMKAIHIHGVQRLFHSSLGSKHPVSQKVTDWLLPVHTPSPALLEPQELAHIRHRIIFKRKRKAGSGRQYSNVFRWWLWKEALFLDTYTRLLAILLPQLTQEYEQARATDP